MTPDGFLTFAGLLIAAYAALGESARLRIRSQLFAQSVAAMILIAPAFVLLFLPSNCSSIQFLPRTCDSQHLSFLLVTIWILVAYLIFRYSPPTAFGMKRLEVYIEDLVSQKRFGELCSFIEPFLETIFLACEERLPLQFARSCLQKYSGPGHDFFDFPKKAHEFPKYLKFLMRAFSVCLPTRRQASESARRIIELLEVEEEFLDHCVASNSSIVVGFLKRRMHAVNNINEALLKKLYTNRDSILLRELRRVDSMQGMRFWAIPQGCKVLSLIPGEPRLVIQQLAWKPIGDAIVAEIETNPITREQLTARESADEALLFRMPVWLGLHFFDIMVTQAVKERVDDHMWLMYMSVFVQKILAVADMHQQGLDKSDEFPNLGARILYEITRIQSNWIELSLPTREESPEDFNDGFRNRSSLFYWAVRDYCHSVRSILESANATRRFKSDRLESFVHLIERFSREDEIRIKLCENLVFGDPDYPDDQGELIAEYFSQIDHVRRFNASDLAKLLGDQQA